MAGDWIKMRMDLPEDPAVYRLARITGLDRLSVIGRLYAFWAWADKHSVDGRVDGASTLDVDDITRHDGFADAMAQVKWLDVGTDFLAIPKHDRHNGESAKERSLKNARQARWRENKVSDVDALPSTKTSTREEKRREEKNPPTPKGADDAFERFWTAYPRKVGKDAARKAFDKRKPSGEMVASMLTALASQIHSPNWTKDDGQFIPHPTTWLNEGRWQDEVGGSVDGGSRFAGCI